MRVFDAAAHNRIANHPEVRPSFAWFEGEVTFDDQAADVDNYVFLLDGDAAAIFEWSAPRVWQVHTLALPDVRGAAALASGRRMIAWMRAEMGARTLWGMTPIANRAARMFNRLIGAKSAGFREHHVTGPCELFVWEG